MGRRYHAPVRTGSLALALILAVFSVADYLAWRANHTRLTGLAAASGLALRRPEIEHELRRKPAPTRAARQLAWSLLDLELDRGWLAKLPAGERRDEVARGRQRLELAESLAAEVLDRQPGSWQALTVLGAARYLAAEREGRRERPDEAWRAPLAAAMRLAPEYPEPPQLLAAAELSRWSALSAARRAELLPLLSRALATPRGMDLLLPAWVRVAPSLSDLFATIPDRPPAWQRLSAEFARLGDHERWARTHRRWQQSLPSFLAQQVTAARARLAAGDRRSAEGLLRHILAAPHDLAQADSFAAALSLLPDETARGRVKADLRRWLDWALDLCLVGRCPFDEATFRRLGQRIADLDRLELALAALAAGDLPTAAAHEPAAGSEDQPDWNRYWIYRAQRLAAGDREAARLALSRVVRRPPDELRFWSAKLQLAQMDGDDDALAEARRSLARLERSLWPPSHWSGGITSYRLELLTTTPGHAVSLQTGDTARSAAIDLRWDGRAIGIAALEPGESHRWRLEVEPGLHLVEVVCLGGRPLLPAALRLEAASPAG